MTEFPDKGFREDSRFVQIRANITESAEALFYHFLFDGLTNEEAMVEVLGRFDKVIQSASGPVFDDAGFIPPIQVCTEAEVVRWFGVNDHRDRLIERIRDWISLARAVHARRFLLDGSFVTKKDEPGDVDAVMLLPDDFREQVRSGKTEAVALYNMFRTREPKELFAAEDEEDWWRWFGFFSRTREANGRCKGLIEVML
jgi:hypothetical protein